MNQPLLVILAMLLCAFRNCPVFEVKRIFPVLVLLITPVAVLTRFALILSVPWLVSVPEFTKSCAQPEAASSRSARRSVPARMRVRRCWLNILPIRALCFAMVVFAALFNIPQTPSRMQT
jgi:hypothetical protein